MFSILVALLLLSGSFNANTYSNFVAAEDFSYYNTDDDGADSEEYYNKFTVCANSIILVEEMSIVCDSPGAYYYGSNKYRNSVKCQAGDKARLQIILEITQDLTSGSYYGEDGQQQQQANNGNDDAGVIPYIYLTAQGHGTIASEYLYDGTALCSLSTLKALDGQTCPEAGSYQLSEVFYWGASSQSDSSSSNYDYTFRPHVTVGMSSNVASSAYDLGGANTARCSSGGTYTNWTSGITNTLSSTLSPFFITIGIIAAGVCVIFAIGWYIRYLVHAAAMRRAKHISQRDVLVDDDYMDEEDMRRIAMMGRERDLIQTVGTT
jgi:hypothetical protein